MFHLHKAEIEESESETTFENVKDIEDLTKAGCTKNRNSCEGSCNRVSNAPIHVNWNDDRKEWHKIFDLQSLFDILSKSGNKPYMLVVGNTAHGYIIFCTP